MLRSRRSRREEPLGDAVPEPIVEPEASSTPSTRRCSPTRSGSRCSSCSRRSPAERLAFVLHDMFAVPVRRDRPDRRPLARRRAPAREPRAAPGAGRGAGARPRPGRPARGRRRVRRRRARGDFDALVAVLDPDVVLRVDAGPCTPGLARGPRRGGRGRAGAPLRRARPFAQAGARQRRGRVRRRAARTPGPPSPASPSRAAGSSRSTCSPTRTRLASSTSACSTAEPSAPGALRPKRRVRTSPPAAAISSSSQRKLSAATSCATSGETEIPSCGTPGR